MKVPDRSWVETDPMGHEHRFHGDALPTLDLDFRCRRCGHQAQPRFLAHWPARGKSTIRSLNIESRREPIVSMVAGTGALEHLNFPLETVMTVETLTGQHEVFLTEDELRELPHTRVFADMVAFAEKILAKKGVTL